MVLFVARGERVALARGAQRLHLQQFDRGVMGLFARPALGLFPGVAAEFMQRRLIGVGAGVAADLLQVGDGNVEFVAAGIGGRKKFIRPVADVERLQAEIAADAVVLVDDRIVDAQFGEIADLRLGIGRALQAPAALGGALAVQLRFGDDGDGRIG